MKSVISLLTSLFLFPAVFAQDYEPTILILAPHASEADRKLQKELNELDTELQSNTQEQKSTPYTESDEFVALPGNIKLMTLSQIAFSEERTFIKMTSYLAQQYLSYQLYERFTNMLILLSKNTSAGQRTELSIMADSAKTQYVLNFPSITLFRKGSISYSKVRVQLFDNVRDEYLVDREFTGDSSNPGFEFACKAGSLDCTINNALSQALADVLGAIAENSPTLQRERQLQQERYGELMSNHFAKSGSLDLVKQIIHDDDQISADKIFHVLYDGTHSKFVAFSLEQVESQDFNTFKDKKKDRNVKIISSKTIKDKDFFASMPQTYAFIIKGVKYDGEWYYEKSNVTYFEAESVEEGRRTYFNNLQKWNFFMENSTMVSPNFWETVLFEKVPDLRQHPDWDKYGDDMWKSQEANNRSYIGMYEIVANVKRKNKQAENELFEKQVKGNILRPAYELLKKKNSETWTDYSDHSLIYSSTRDVAINPVLLTNSKGLKMVRYFVVFPTSNEIFEWTYFPASETRDGSIDFGSTVVDQLESITDWNFSYDALDDDEFWKKYILLKENETYKYLTKVSL